LVTDFLEFDRPVRSGGELYYEAGLRRADGGTSRGAFGPRGGALIADAEFDLILRAWILNAFMTPASTAMQEFPGFADEAGHI